MNNPGEKTTKDNYKTLVVACLFERTAKSIRAVTVPLKLVLTILVSS